jgi:hypothetical protein
MEINLHQEIIKLLINTLHNCNNSITVICSEEETDNFKLNSNLTVKFKKLTVVNFLLITVTEKQETKIISKHEDLCFKIYDEYLLTGKITKIINFIKNMINNFTIINKYFDLEKTYDIEKIKFKKINSKLLLKTNNIDIVIDNKYYNFKNVLELISDKDLSKYKKLLYKIFL